MEYFLGWLVKQVPKLIEAGVDVIEITGITATRTVGLAFFEKYVLAYPSAKGVVKYGQI
jgi:hypothetical protein